MKEYFFKLLAYDLWANNEVIKLVTTIYEQDELVARWLSHILNAQIIWLDRVKQQPLSTGIWDLRPLGGLAQEFSNVSQNWQNYINTLTEDISQIKVAYHNTKGEAFESRLEDILAHIVNHGTHHRSAIQQRAKAYGLNLMPLDYIFFARS